MFNPDIQKMGKDALVTAISFNAIKDQHGKYLWANQQFCNLFDTPLHRVIGKYNDDFFYPACYENINKHDSLIAEGKLQLQETQACLLTTTDKVLHIVGNKMKIDLGNNNIGIAGECTILDKKNPISSFLNERITDKLPIEANENLSVTQLKIIYCLICFPNIKPKEISYLLCALPSTIYRETQNIKEKLGATSRNTLLTKMLSLGFFDRFFLSV